ncbi:unnamed protein product [Enterobius vermicularis]|uniref:Uncharacterized protein n=1 Tax=Enterobius vermicularis TaxID=51028 RepID=A0A0N4VMG2_ENTVE|nr:unnamed protein product [Enterobius vermicularis]
MWNHIPNYVLKGIHSVSQPDVRYFSHSPWRTRLLPKLVPRDSLRICHDLALVRREVSGRSASGDDSYCEVRFENLKLIYTTVLK